MLFEIPRPYRRCEVEQGRAAPAEHRQDRVHDLGNTGRVKREVRDRGSLERGLHGNPAGDPCARIRARPSQILQNVEPALAVGDEADGLGAAAHDPFQPVGVRRDRVLGLDIRDFGLDPLFGQPAVDAGHVAKIVAEADRRDHRVAQIGRNEQDPHAVETAADVLKTGFDQCRIEPAI